jgi:TonB-dependent SusC/RagA subfamily outer membrane receptor
MLKRMYKLLLVWAFATLLIPSQLFAQTVIKGTIRSSVDQMPLEGVSVVIKGTKIGTQSNVSGQFSITAKNGDGLEISFIGYSSQLISITTATASLDVKLTPLKKELDEVIVVGYGTQKKANITGSVSTIKMDDLLGSRPVSSTGALLQGAIPGLQVTTGSGQPGASTNFNIRGGTDFGTSATSSINTGSPFILLDNVPFNGALNLIDPNDIESITVLKDAGSAAIYGARSAFGVVLVTTKKGNKNQKTQFTYNNNLVFADPTNLPTKASPIQQVQSWIDGGMTPAYVGNQNLKTWMQLLNAYQATPDLYPSGNTVSGGVYYQLAPTDAIKALLGNSAFQQMHNFALSGGSDKTTYRISLGTTNEDGIMVPSSKQDNYKRYNIKSLV